MSSIELISRGRALPVTALTVALLVVPLLLCYELAWGDKPVKPKTTVTQAISPQVYKQMEAAQKAFEAKDYKGAEAALDKIKAGYDKLNDYEKATLWNLYAAVYRSENDNQRAIQAYFNLLKQNNLPEGLRNDGLFSLAQTYFLIEDYRNAIRVLQKWIAVVPEPQPDAYVLEAQAYYQLGQYEQAKQATLQALRIAKKDGQPFKENWLALLRATYYETKDYPHAIQVMEALVQMYPKGTYLTQLSGLYGLQGDQRKQAVAMNVAYLGGMIDNASDLLNMARLYMAQGAPQRAVDLIIAKLRDKTLAINAENLQLLAQAQTLARDIEQSVPVLSRLAEMTGESRHYVFLGQAYTQLGQWDKAASAFEAALKAKNPSNPAGIRMQLGTAYYNQKKLQAARAAFVAAAESPNEHDTATTWVKFIDTELQRDAALKRGVGDS
ncbi:MAG: tetratricopeptide repeat protein [Sinobacteraceae bacterium]|nr:tetratricopeptide repeat protein [Nevskiaceae bacterium]